MMLINGRVVGESLDGANVNDGCKETCYNLTNCILAFMDSHNNCILFDFNSTIQLEVEETEKTDGFMVAFKTWLPSDSCPIYSEMIPVVKIGEDTIPWTKTSNTFNFLKCVGDWKMFQRPDGITVCIKPFLSTVITITAARDYCESIGYNITGLATVVESQWVMNTMFQMGQGFGDFDGFWVDGYRNCSRPCNNFTYTDGYTVTGDVLTRASLSFDINNVLENCLQVARIASVDPTNFVNDVNCNWSTYGKGVVCGYQLV
uniref:CW domain-containing protein n=1 Tax=Caenorhabditis tropicalis TaxID=1561998 RepID=A0A1I7UZF2_9PELO